VLSGLALTCEFPTWHSWEGPETAAGAYGNYCKPAHTVHVVNIFNLNFNTRTQQLERKNEDQEGFYVLMTWRSQKKILSDPVSLSARDFFLKRTNEEPLVRRKTRRIEDFGARHFANYMSARDVIATVRVSECGFYVPITR
jgi:hypothetical protein